MYGCCRWFAMCSCQMQGVGYERVRIQSGLLVGKFCHNGRQIWTCLHNTREALVLTFARVFSGLQPLRRPLVAFVFVTCALHILFVMQSSTCLDQAHPYFFRGSLMRAWQFSLFGWWFRNHISQATWEPDAFSDNFMLFCPFNAVVGEKSMLQLMWHHKFSVVLMWLGNAVELVKICHRHVFCYQ
jgi:hypothetical protein